MEKNEGGIRVSLKLHDFAKTFDAGLYVGLARGSVPP